MHNASHSSWYIGVFNKWKLLGLFPELMEDRINQYNRQDFRLQNALERHFENGLTFLQEVFVICVMKLSQ